MQPPCIPWLENSPGISSSARKDKKNEFIQMEFLAESATGQESRKMSKESERGLKMRPTGSNGEQQRTCIGGAK